MNWQRLRMKYWVDLFRRDRLEQDLDEELQAHLAIQIRRRVELGASPETARTAALQELRSAAYVKGETRDTWAWRSIEQFVQDLRIGFRMLRRTPGFCTLSILCLTLGIGATAAVFSWIEGILLRPFPAVANQDRLMAIAGTSRDMAGSNDISWPDFVDLEKGCTLLDAFIVDRITGITLSIGERAELTAGSVVSANYFEALGVRPILGRGFEPAEDFGRNAHPVTVISYQLWRDRFAGDPQTIPLRSAQPSWP